IGVGRIGGAVAEEAKRLGLKVLGVRRTGAPHQYVDEMVGPDRLATILPKADFVLVTTVMTPASRNLIGRRELGLVKAGAGVVALTRVIDLEALAEKLNDGHLSGAVVNAFPAEPLPETSPLWDTQNLILTPHVGTQDEQQFVPKVLDIFLD